ncbi:hypothetical protein AAFC00_003029 [Neodothiora populina]|uniref:UBX domain-containing protein n=1 Tax=Neodothiora populina TaxID=2781224 RepID=A0ABR3P9R7_9PEZI
MATPSVDIATLSQQQQEALQQFTAVTDQEVASAITLLDKCQWNVQIAITRFFDGDADTVDPVAEAARAPPPQNSRRTETLMDSIPLSTFPTHRPGVQPAPRVVATPESQRVQPAPLLFSLLFLPFNITYNIFSRVFGTVGYFFPIIPRLLHRLFPRQLSPSRNTGRRPLNPRDTASRFIAECNEQYGANRETIPFVESGYAQAFDAAKRDLKYLLVILVSPEHDDTSPFFGETLLAPEVTSFFRSHKDDMIIWGGSVQDSEAYQVANNFNVTKFPFTGLITHTPASPTSMAFAARIAGTESPAALISKLQEGMQQRSEELERLRRQRREQEATRSMRDEQNSAYERSLAQDRERARQRREAEAAREQAEREAREKAEAAAQKARNVAAWRSWRAQSIAEEPAADTKDVVRISLRMPSGDRVVRRFAPDAQLEELYAVVECFNILQNEAPSSEKAAEAPAGYEHEYEFQLVSPMPREVYDLEKGGSIGSRIGRSGNLIVERLVDDDDDEDGEGGEEATA